MRVWPGQPYPLGATWNESHNLSWNCGVEGPTDDRAVNTLRQRQMRNFLATLLLSQGVPMISHGDEVGRTQYGNNNAYCQDNELSWIDWNLDDRVPSTLPDLDPDHHWQRVFDTMEAQTPQSVFTTTET